jgi:hypothetical protein
MRTLPRYSQPPRHCKILGVCNSISQDAGQSNNAYLSYTAIWNLLDYPGAVFPTGLVADPTVDVYQKSPSPMSAADEYNISLC